MSDQKVKKVKCKKCYGVGYYSSKYGQKACEPCNAKGYTYENVKSK